MIGPVQCCCHRRPCIGFCARQPTLASLRKQSAAIAPKSIDATRFIATRFSQSSTYHFSMSSPCTLALSGYLYLNLHLHQHPYLHFCLYMCVAWILLLRLSEAFRALWRFELSVKACSSLDWRSLTQNMSMRIWMFRLRACLFVFFFATFLSFCFHLVLALSFLLVIPVLLCFLFVSCFGLLFFCV